MLLSSLLPAHLTALVLTVAAVSAQRDPRPAPPSGNARPAVGVAGAPEQADESVDAARARNKKAYARVSPDLHRDPASPWVVIAGGKVAARGATLEDVLKNAPEAPHRFVFQVGSEGDSKEFITTWYGPRFGGGKLFGLLEEMGFTWTCHVTTGFRFSRNGKPVPPVSPLPFPRIQLEIAPPGGKPLALTVFPNTVGPPLVLTPEDYLRLGLARFEVPGTLTIETAFGGVVPCRRVLVRISVPGFDVHGYRIASVPICPRKVLVDLSRKRSAIEFWPGDMSGEKLPGRWKGKWVLYGVDQVMGEGTTPEQALRDGKGKVDFAYHRFLVRLPLGEPLVLNRSDFGQEKCVKLNGLEVAVRAGQEHGPFLVSRESAEPLHLELAEEGREVRFKGEKTGHLQAGYAWLGDLAPSRLALVVVEPAAR